MDWLVARYRESVPNVVPWDKIQATVDDLYLAEAPRRMKEAALYALVCVERSRPFGWERVDHAAKSGAFPCLTT
jgi:hypothetical protein